MLDLILGNGKDLPITTLGQVTRINHHFHKEMIHYIKHQEATQGPVN